LNLIKFFFFFWKTFDRDIAHQSSYNTKKVCLIHHIQLTLWKSSLTKIYTSGRFLEKQCFKRLGIRDWGTACEILTDESNYFICSKIIPCHESYIAIIVLPNLHFFIVGRIYMNHLQMAIIASQRERRRNHRQSTWGSWIDIEALLLTVLLGSYDAWAAASILSNSKDDLWPTKTTCLWEGTEIMSAAQHIRGTAIAMSFNLDSKTACIAMGWIYYANTMSTRVVNTSLSPRNACKWSNSIPEDAQHSACNTQTCCQSS